MDELAEVRTGAFGATFGGAAVVGGEDHNSVVEFAERLDGVEDAPHRFVHAVHHRCVDLLIPLVSTLLIRRKRRPFGRVVSGFCVPGCHLGLGREESGTLLRVESILSHRIPSFGVLSAEPVQVLRLGLMRTVHRDVREVQKEGFVRVVRPQPLDLADGPVGDVVSDVVVVGILLDVDHRVVGHQLVRIVERVHSLQGSVVAVESPLNRPGFTRPAGPLIDIPHQMPLPDGEVRIAVLPQYLRKCEDVVGEFQSETGVAGIEVGDRSVTGPVGVQPGQQRRAGR